MAEVVEAHEEGTAPLPPAEFESSEQTLGELPLDLEADFAPLKELETEDQASGIDDDPYLGNSLAAQVAFEGAAVAAQAGNEEEAVKQYLRASKLAEMAHEWYLAAVSCQRVGDFLSHPKPPTDLERAFRMYHRAIAAYNQCGYFTEARNLSYHLLWTKMRRARELHLSSIRRLELAVAWALAGFGYRPLRIVGTTIGVILLYGLLFWALGGMLDARQQSHCDLGECLYFSGITFTTVGYGDLAPAPHTRFLALTEGIVGAFTMGFFVVVVGNRLRT